MKIRAFVAEIFAKQYWCFLISDLISIESQPKKIVIVVVIGVVVVVVVHIVVVVIAEI